MNEIVNKRSLNKAKIIMLLTVIAVIGTVLDGLTFFISWNSHDGLSFYLPDGMTLLWFVAYLAPCLLFALYIYNYHSKFKATALIPFAFGCVAISPILSFLDAFRYDYELPAFDLILYIAAIASFLLVSFSSTKGIIKKPFLIAAVVTGVLMETGYLESISWYLEDNIYIFAVSTIIGFIGQVSLYSAMLLFGLYNRLPVKDLPVATANDIPAEQALRMLKDEYDAGMISEEEYFAKRKEIINNL